MEIVSSSPAQGETIGTRRVFVDLCLDRVVDPGSVDPDDLRIRSGVVFYDAGVDVELLNWRAPGSLEAGDSPWCPGSVLRVRPRSPLEAGVDYRVTLYDGVRGWHGERFDLESEGWLVPDAADTEGSNDDRFEDPRYTLRFRVDPQAPEEVEPPTVEPRSLATLFEPGAVFDPAASCSCHADSEDPASALLNLRDPESAYRSLVLDTRISSTGARRVEPGSAHESYVVQKLARDGDQPLHAVAGRPMPPDAPLSHAHLAQLSAWIEEGALP